MKVTKWDTEESEAERARRERKGGVAMDCIFCAFRGTLNDLKQHSSACSGHPAVKALNEIASIGGNIPDERLISPTGPRDAAARGLMYVRARSIAMAHLNRKGFLQ